MSTHTNCLLDNIRIDGGTQSRVSINEEAVTEYAEAIRDGATLPQVVVFFDGADHWLADGFHRYHAHRKVGATEIDADIRPGTKDDAKLYAYGANQSHGLRRTNDDKRKAVLGMLADFGDWSDRKIAKHVGVGHPFVAACRSPEAAKRQDANRLKSAAKVESDSTPVPQAPAAAAPERARATGAPESKAPAPEQDDDGPTVDQLLAEMQEDLRRSETRTAELEKALTDGGKEQVATLMRRLEHAERQRDDAMSNAARLQREVDRLMRNLMACGKAVGERDQDKIVRAVQAFARSHQEAA